MPVVTISKNKLSELAVGDTIFVKGISDSAKVTIFGIRENEQGRRAFAFEKFKGSSFSYVFTDEELNLCGWVYEAKSKYVLPRWLSWLYNII